MSTLAEGLSEAYPEDHEGLGIVTLSYVDHIVNCDAAEQLAFGVDDRCGDEILLGEDFGNFGIRRIDIDGGGVAVLGCQAVDFHQ